MIAALVPVKHLGAGKSRLLGSLDRDAIERLTLAMLGDILAALESGQLSEATLDVFRTEPLPADHPFWGHPRVTVTPHNASVTAPDSATRQVLENIARFRRGEARPNIVDPGAGY